MKKRISKILALLLCSLLIFALMPACVSAADDYDVYINNVRLNSELTSVELGGGSASWNEETKTLTLKNATLTTTDDNYGINFTAAEDVTIVLEGENVVDSTVSVHAFAIRATNNLTIKGSGKLKAISHIPAIQAKTLVIDGAKIDATGDAAHSTAVECENLRIINKADVTLKGDGSGVSILTAAEIKDSTVKATGTADNSNAIYAEGTLNISKSEFEGESGYPALYSAGNMTVSDSKVNIRNQKGGGGIWSDAAIEMLGKNDVMLNTTGYGMGAANGIKIKDGTYEIKSGSAAIVGSGIDFSEYENVLVLVSANSDGSGAQRILSPYSNISEMPYAKIFKRNTAVKIEIPFTKVVKQVGSKPAPKETFSFELFDYAMNNAEEAITVKENTVTTSSKGNFNGKIVFNIDEKDIDEGILQEGFKVREVKGSGENWVYSDEVYYVSIDVDKTLTNEGNIYFVSGIKYYKLVNNEINYDTPENSMSFTNIYKTEQVKPGDSDSPKTGDNNNIILYSILLALSGIGIVSVIIYSRKKQKK